MRYTKQFAGFALAAGMMLAGTGVLRAEDWRRDRFRDEGRVERLRADIARDRARLDEDLRCRRFSAARRDRADLERDERKLDRYGWRR